MPARTGPAAYHPTRSSTLARRRIGLLALIAPVLLSGCGVLVKKSPTIAHVHVGHALTAWPATPDKSGLLQTAEREADTALRSALAATRTTDLAQIKRHLRDVAHAIDPLVQPGVGVIQSILMGDLRKN